MLFHITYISRYSIFPCLSNSIHLCCRCSNRKVVIFYSLHFCPFCLMLIIHCDRLSWKLFECGKLKSVVTLGRLRQTSYFHSFFTLILSKLYVSLVVPYLFSLYVSNARCKIHDTLRDMSIVQIEFCLNEFTLKRNVECSLCNMKSCKQKPNEICTFS